MLNTERYYMPAARKNQEKRPAVQQILHNFRYTSHNFQNIFNFFTRERIQTRRKAARRFGRDTAKKRKPPAQKGDTNAAAGV